MSSQLWPGKDFSFKSSIWSGTTLFAVFAFLALLSLCAWFAVISWTKFANIGLSAFVWAFTAFIALAFYSTLKPALNRQSLLAVTSHGITSSQWNNATISWNDVADIQQEYVQGHEYLSVILHKNSPSATATKRWFHGRGLKRQIGLAMLHKDDRQNAVPWTLQAWKAYGGQHASAAMAKKEIQTQELESFNRQLEALTPMPWAVYLMMVACFAIWLANVISGMSVVAPTSAQLWSWGGNSAASVKLDGQYWRLLTSAFLHGGLVHLALNMLGLWSAGQLLNRLHGNFNFLLIYIGSALGGSALSLHFAAQKSVSIGASGAVLGVLGALLISVYQHKERVPTLFSKEVLTGQGVFLAYALIYGFTQPSIDNAAHIGGLVAGALLAWVLIEKLDTKHGTLHAHLKAALGIFLIGIGVLGLIYTAKSPIVHHRQVFAFENGLQKLQPLMQGTLQAIELDSKSVQTGKISDEQLVQLIEAKHLPALRDIESTLAQLRLPAGNEKAAFSQDMHRHFELIRLLMEKQILISNAQPHETLELQRQSSVLQTELQQVSLRIKQFVEQQKVKNKKGNG